MSLAATAGQAGDNLLEVRGLSATYQATAVLKSVDIDVARGGITALLGANGAGKTTLLRAISHALVKTQGSIRFDGQPIEGLPSDAVARLGIAHVPDGRGTFTQLTVEENLLVGAITRPRGGEQQMVAIARALMLRPRLLMLDEPSFGLAPLVVRQIFEVLGQINREGGLSILVVEQNARLALDLARHAYVLEAGRVAISGPAASLRSDPRVKKAYLGI